MRRRPHGVRMKDMLRHEWVWCCLVLVACGQPELPPGSRCLTLSPPETGEGLSTSLPARVSLFFGVDTCEGAPVAGLDASAFEVQEDGRPLSPLESQRAVAPRGQQVRVASLLLLDLSGSVLRAGDFTALKEAATRYVKTVLGPRDAGQRLAIYSFDGREVPQRLAAFTADQATALAALEGLDVKECASNLDCAGFVDHRTCAGWRCVDDSTNLNGAIVKALDTLDDQLALEPEVRWKEAALVVFTDGTDQASRVSHGELLSRLDRSKVRRFTVGLGAEIEEKSLTAIGVDGSWPVAKASGLSDAFAAVAAKVTARANRFYALEYCSPKRSGQHSVKVTARWTTPAGEVLLGGRSWEFDAQGFGSGCVVSGE